MELPTETIQTDGEQFEVSYQEFLICGECSELWDITRADPEMTDDTDYLDENGRCPHCSTSRGHRYVKHHHLFVKDIWWTYGQPKPDIDTHTSALRYFARKLDAMKGDGWKPIDATGEHLLLEKEIIESIDSVHRITDDLE